MFSLSFIRFASNEKSAPALAVATLVAVSLLPNGIPAQSHSELRIDYTGRLFGYYRIEASEPLLASPPEFSGVKLDPVRAFLNSQIQNADPESDTLLLGMGDNFAPEFGASIQQEFRTRTGSVPCESHAAGGPPITDARPSDWHRSAPEALYKSATRMPVLADCDNVTRFLIAAGYAAVVPGREDFIYSATWLRRIAFLLRGAGSRVQKINPIPESNGKWTHEIAINPDRPLHMLAANIRVKTTGNLCPLLFAEDIATKSHPCVEAGGTSTAEMDWFRRLDETLNSWPVEHSIERQAAANVEFREQTVMNQVSILSSLFDAYNCTSVPELAIFARTTPYVIDESNGTFSLKTASKDLREPNSTDSHNLSGEELLASARKKLTAIQCQANGEVGRDEAAEMIKELGFGALDAIVAATGKSSSQHDILVSRSLRQKAEDLFLNLIYAEQKEAGFAIAKLPSGKHVLLIGVVGQETMQQISPVNFRVFPDYQDCSESNESAEKSAVCEAKRSRNPMNSNTPRTEVNKAFSLSVGDPHLAVTAILRAAWAARAREHATNPDESHPLFDSVIVMAQMPPSEAEELAHRVRADIQTSFSGGSGTESNSPPSIDLILSEAQLGHETQSVEMHFAPGSFTPVLVPPDASSRWRKDAARSVAAVTLSEQPGTNHPQLSRLLVNSLPAAVDLQLTLAAKTQDVGCDTAACRLKDQLDAAWTAWIEKHPRDKRPVTGEIDLDAIWKTCVVNEDGVRQYDDHSCQASVLMRYLLHQLQRSSKSDVVLLERRDFYFDWLGKQYGDYSVCDQWGADAINTELQEQAMPARFQGFYHNYCRLKVALDRVLWKGDYSERVMVDGATLTSLINTAKQQTDQEQALLPRDLHQDWLMTEGVVTSPPKNLVTAGSGPDAFSLPGSDGCNNGANASSSSFCINGQSILADHAYWVTTSDQLAQDTIVYSALGSLASKPNYASPMQSLFVTTEIADEVVRRGQVPELVAANAAPTGSRPADSAEANLAKLEMLNQDRNLIQLEFSKLALGYTFTSPSLSDAALAARLTGVSNTQADTPHSEELDLEGASRLTSAPVLDSFVVGAQTDAEYDRKVLGNLAGNPETVTYSANSFTVGGFAQVAIHNNHIPWLARRGVNQSTRNLPRAFIVFAPYQYQRQMTGAFLNFPFFTPPNTTNSQQQLSVHLPTAMGFSQRAGFRYEFAGIWKWTPDPASYFEIGPEFAEQNNVLSAVRLPQLSSTAVCEVEAAQSIQTCVKNLYKAADATLNSASTLLPVTETLHAGGLYWNVHLQKVIDKQKTYSASFDTQGDSFLLPGATLTTQTRYAFSTKLALNFRIAGNLSLSPTYSDFFFENQGVAAQRTALLATSFTIAAKWYFARDAQVPFHKQLWFSGPNSIDQTSAAKVK